MSHLIWGGICFSWLNTTMSVMSIVDMSNLLALILSQRTPHELGLEWMEDIAGCVGEVVKRLNKVKWDPMGSVLLIKSSLYIPRTPPDMFIFPLDQTTRHHDSAQPHHTGPLDYQDTPSDLVQIILLCSQSISLPSSTASASLLLLILIMFHDNKSMVPPFFFPMLPSFALPLLPWLFPRVKGIFPCIHLFLPTLFISLTHLSHTLLLPLFISLWSFVWSTNTYKHSTSISKRSLCTVAP